MTKNIVFDVNGKELHEGDLVAFNRSGDVRVGRVAQIGKTVYRSYDKEKRNPIITVKINYKNKLSVVKNPNSIHILDNEILNSL